MKILTIIVPCYHSAAYMQKCIDSLLPAGENIEIIIVNDGSYQDKTGEIADGYAKNYPNIVRAIHKQNGGHGSALNAGIKEAKGLYIKVVDSDDWVNTKSLLKIIDKLVEMINSNSCVDMLISNFMYDKEGAVKKKVMHYHGLLPENREFTWEQVKTFSNSKYILMHSVIYKTSVLRNCGLQLPEHTFYVDSIYVYQPLPFVKTMYYMNVTLYHYFIGRSDQSVNERIMISRIDQQLKVNKLLFDCHDVSLIQPKQLQRYMYQYLEIINAVSCVLLIKEGSREKLRMKQELWNYMKERNLKMFGKLRYRKILGLAVNTPGILGRKAVIGIYTIAQKAVGFN